MKKIVIPGLTAGYVKFVTMWAFSTIEGAIFPAIHTEYENYTIFRPPGDPFVMYFFFHPFVLGILLFFVWQNVKEIIKEADGTKKGALFRVSFWIVSTGRFALELKYLPDIRINVRNLSSQYFHTTSSCRNSSCV